jgi:RHS repeat-associated protein
VRTDKITYTGAAGNLRTIVVEYMPYRSRTISDDEKAPPFPELGIANSNSNFEVVSGIRLPDGRYYQFFYNRYAEVVKVLLPTGGRIEYDYAAGLLNPFSFAGVLPSGQVLTDDPTQYGAPLTSFHRPYIYRRLIERRAYLNGNDLNPIRKTTYSRPEVATFETRANQVTTSVQITTAGYVEVTEYSRNTASQEAAVKAQVRKHFFFSQDSLGQPSYLGAAARLGVVYPPGTSSMAGYPNPYEAKEYRTQLLNPSDTSILLSQKDESWTVTAGGRAYACNTQDTLLDGSSTLKSRKATVRDDYYNETHAYEFAYGDGPEIGGPIGCWSDLTSHYRRTVTAYQNSPYDNANGPYMPSLANSVSVFSGSGIEVAKSTVAYDEYQAENNPPSGFESRTAALVARNNLTGNQAVYASTYTTRGNPTTIASQIKALAGFEPLDRWVVQSRQYDAAGNVVKELDGLRNVTSISYSNTYSNAFPTAITNALQQTTTATYDLNIGKPESVTDANMVTTFFGYLDPFERLKSIVRSGAETTFDYVFASGSATTTVRKSKKVLSSTYQRSDQIFDGLGRGVIARTSKDGNDCGLTGSNCLISFKVLDGLDREVEVYNPTDGVVPSSCASFPCAKIEFDGLGRVTKKILPDNLQSTIVYSIGNTGAPVLRTLSTDPAQVQSATEQDAFGRVVNAVEYPASGGLWITAYQYDLLNNLTKVTQGSQQRDFKYDSLSRLREADNRETGKISYVYDDNGNLKEKKDGRSASLNAMVIDYDKLNRILKKSYPSTAALTPDVHFTYDIDLRQQDDALNNYPVGQLVRVRVGLPTDETNQTIFHRFDSLGRVEKATQQVDSNKYVTAYSYDFANQLRTLGYPKGWSLTYDYNPLGQVIGASKGGVAYASQMQYYPHGAPKQMTLGNGLVSKWDFNARLQLTKTQLGTTGVANSVAEFRLFYDGITCEVGTNWVNNGNVVKQDIVVGAVTFTQTYGYDKLNRLSCVKEGDLANPSWKQEFQYDRYGNRWTPPGTNTLPYTETIAATVAADYDLSTNRLITQPTGGLANYDGAGNLKRLAGGTAAAGPGTHDLSYDGENRIYQSNRFGAITGYVYDGFGRRVKRTGTLPAYFAYDVSGNLLMEDGGEVESTGVQYVTQDHLGSTRVMTDQAGAVVRRYDYAPFGEDLKLAGGRTVAQKYPGSDAELKDKVRFTGKERDGETGMDYFGARYMSAAQGRFTTPDPLGASGKASNPQTWNRYAYALNNPLKFVDPDGMEVPDSCVKDVNCTIVIKLNVVYDARMNRGRGPNQKQRQKWEKEQLAKAQKDYGSSNIQLEATYTPGSYDVGPDGQKPVLTGLNPDALNVVVSQGTPNNKAGASSNNVTIINIDDAVAGNWWPFAMNTTTHELGHHFLGHTGTRPKGVVDVTSKEYDVDNRLLMQSLGRSQPDFREGVKQKRYAVPLNPEANKPRQ